MNDIMQAIDISVKTINNAVFNLNVSKNMTVHDLKAKIKDSTEITEERQRLIYRGQVLADNHSLTDYRIEDGHTIHLVSRPSNFRELQHSAQSSPEQSIQGLISPHEDRNGNVLRQAHRNQISERGSSSLLTLSALTDSLIQSRGVSTTNGQTSEPTSTNTNASNRVNNNNNSSNNNFEHIRQGLLTMHTLMSTMESFQSHRTFEEKVEESESLSDLGVPFFTRSPDVRHGKSFSDCKPSSNTNSTRLEDSRSVKRDAKQLAEDGQHRDRDRISTPNSALYGSSSEGMTSNRHNLTRVCSPRSERRGNRPGRGDRGALNQTRESDTEDSKHSASSVPVEPTLAPPSSREPSPPPPPAGPPRMSFYEGQWLDVKDTVSQWLEATVLRVDDSGDVSRVFVHYNGWPPRWDEWLNVNSPRIAPFRTRTVHSPTVGCLCPTPNVPLPFAPATGQDDMRMLLPEIHTMMLRLTPTLSEAAALSEESLTARPLEVDANNIQGDSASVRPCNPLWTPDSSRKTFGTGFMSASAAPSVSASYRRTPQLRQLAAELCPLLDRFGRILTDLAPHLREFADEVDATTARTGEGECVGEEESEPPEFSSEDGKEGDNRAHVPRSLQQGHVRRSLRSSERERERESQVGSAEAALLALLRNRSPSPPPETVYRRPILTGPYPRGPPGEGPGGLGGQSNHLDIHIHAILTPLRSANSNDASANTSTAASAPADATATSAVRAPVMMASTLVTHRTHPNSSRSGHPRQEQESADGSVLVPATPPASRMLDLATDGGVRRGRSHSLDSSRAERGPVARGLSDALLDDVDGLLGGRDDAGSSWVGGVGAGQSRSPGRGGGVGVGVVGSPSVHGRSPTRRAWAEQDEGSCDEDSADRSSSGEPILWSSQDVDNDVEVEVEVEVETNSSSASDAGQGYNVTDSVSSVDSSSQPSPVTDVRVGEPRETTLHAEHVSPSSGYGELMMRLRSSLSFHRGSSSGRR